MVMKISKQELIKIKNSVKKLVDNGSTKMYAVSTIASQNNINPKQLMNLLFQTNKSTKQEYNDIKTSEGTYVVLNDDPNKQYEVISITNKDSIVLRDLNTNETIKVKEEEILPVVMENIMKKQLKEANYNLSIDGLETVDAEKLSQILSLAGEAENGTTMENSDVIYTDDKNAYANPDMDTAVVPTDSLDTNDYMDGTISPMDDVDNMNVFEPEMDIHDDMGGYEYEDYEQFPVTESKMDEDVLLDPQSDDETYNAQRKNDESEEMLSEDDMGTEDVNMEVVDKLYDIIINNGKYSIEDIINGDEETPDEMDFVFKYGPTIPGFNGKHFREYCRIITDRLNDAYVCPNCSEIWDKHECKNCGYNPSEDEYDEYDEYDELLDSIIGDGFDESVENEELTHKTPIMEDNIGTSGVKQEVVDKLYDIIVNNGKYSIEDIINGGDETPDAMDFIFKYGHTIPGYDGKLFDEYARIIYDRLDDDYPVCPNCSEIWDKHECENCGYNPSEEDEYDEMDDFVIGDVFDESVENDNTNVDKEIAECLRLAGVELNEVSEEKATKGKKDLPQVVGHKTAFSKAKQNGFKPGENQRPNYKCVRTKDVMGKESTEGFKQTLDVSKVCCNESKIKSICETATGMYAKKDHSEWLALDRRYIEKLINEGVCYTKASKMLLKAKAGK